MIQDSILSGFNSDPSIDLDASILSDYHGDHWGFTGTFVGLVCQDLTVGSCLLSSITSKCDRRTERNF